MRNILSKSGRLLIPIILCIALVFTVFLSTHSINELQGDARVINYIGIVRGATQRLIKKELNQAPDDGLIERLDSILSGLANGSDEFDLIKLDCPEFQALLTKMQSKWADIKEEIYRYRDGAPQDKLYEMSEEYFDLADETVRTAEEYTEKIVRDTRDITIIMNIVFLLMAGISTVFVFYQERRRNKLIEIEHENKRKSEQLSKRLQELLVPMNEITELMYVADIDTYELLFINETGKKTFDVHETDGHVKCYKVLQGFDAPCPFCTNQRLKADETYSWEYTNPLTTKHYLLKDRLIEWEGRPARMELAFDITDSVNEKNELKKRLERDNILVDCIRELYRNHDVIHAITNVLGQIGKLFAADRAYVFLFHGDRFSNIAEWCNDGIMPQIDRLQNLPQSDYRTWFDTFERQPYIVINDIRDLKDTMQEGYDFLRLQGIRNVVWVPLEKDEQLSGCVGLDNQDSGALETIIPFLQTVQYFITIAMQRDENEKTLFELSYLDKLTSFYNRNRYIQDLSDLESRRESVGVVYLDLNGLKEINDCFGHDAGDKMLKRCAEIIQGSFNDGTFYRIGGDEYVMICTDIEEEAFYDHVQRLRNNFTDSGCHVAIGSKWEADSKDIQNTIKAADELMYVDKKNFYQNHHITNRYRHNNDLLHFLANPDILKEKISNHNFRVYLQAKVGLEKGKVVGAEALVRYQDDNGSIHSPDQFIPVLEKSHFINKIDFYVFEEVCRNLLDWKERGRTLITISSNFSRSTFMDEHFVEKIVSISERYEIPRSFLEIEITESASTADFDILKTRINQIRQAGFRVAVDDFGIECSNLALLSITEFDVLKIDKGFVKNIMQNERARLIIKMMVGICRKMNIQLVAEGVETNEQLDILEACGVKVVQGFLFSRPKPISEFEIDAGHMGPR